jgi:uncharacterized hydantoinase/oxoprolinase family protein
MTIKKIQPRYKYKEEIVDNLDKLITSLDGCMDRLVKEMCNGTKGIDIQEVYDFTKTQKQSFENIKDWIINTNEGK